MSQVTRGSSPGSSAKRKPAGKIDVSAKTYDVQAVQWLRTQRSVISDSRQHTTFQREIRALEADLKARPGGTVAAAIGITVGMIVVAVAAVVLGLFLMDLASGLLS